MAYALLAEPEIFGAKTVSRGSASQFIKYVLSQEKPTMIRSGSKIVAAAMPIETYESLIQELHCWKTLYTMLQNQVNGPQGQY